MGIAHLGDQWKRKSFRRCDRPQWNSQASIACAAMLRRKANSGYKFLRSGRCHDAGSIPILSQACGHLRPRASSRVLVTLKLGSARQGRAGPVQAVSVGMRRRVCQPLARKVLQVHNPTPSLPALSSLFRKDQKSLQDLPATNAACGFQDADRVTFQSQDETLAKGFEKISNCTASDGSCRVDTPEIFSR